MIDTILLVIAAICFALYALGIDLLQGRLNLLAVGLFCWVLTALV